MDSVALSEVWAEKIFELLEKDEVKEKGKIKVELNRLTNPPESVEKKLDKLLEFYLEEIVDTEGYQLKKDQLLQKKLMLKEKIKEIKTKGSNWLEPMREFIVLAADAAKIVRRKNNCDELAVIAKKSARTSYCRINGLNFARFLRIMRSPRGHPRLAHIHLITLCAEERT